MIAPNEVIGEVEFGCIRARISMPRLARWLFEGAIGLGGAVHPVDGSGGSHGGL